MAESGPVSDADRLMAEGLWEDSYRQGYADKVMSVSGTPAVQDSVLEEVQKLSEGAKVLIVSCGTDEHIPNLIAQCPNVGNVTGIDFQGVIDQRKPVSEVVASEDCASKIDFKGMDAHSLGEQCSEEYDAVVIVNGAVAPTRAENQSIINNCFESLKPGAKFIGVFPRFEYSLGVAANHLPWLKHPRERALFEMALNRKERTITSPDIGKQHYATTDDLADMMKEAGFEGSDISTLTLDDPVSLKFQRQAYSKPITVGPFKVAGISVGPIELADFSKVPLPPVQLNAVVADKPAEPGL